MRNQKTAHKIAALLLCVCIFLIYTASEVYLANHLQHKCIGRHCSVCYEIRMADNQIQQISSGILSIILVFLVAVVLKIEASAASVFVPVHSLITEKIRLNN